MFGPRWQFTWYLDLSRSDDNIVPKSLDLETDTMSVSIINIDQTKPNPILKPDPGSEPR